MSMQRVSAFRLFASLVNVSRNLIGSIVVFDIYIFRFSIFLFSVSILSASE